MSVFELIIIGVCIGAAFVLLSFFVLSIALDLNNSRAEKILKENKQLKDDYSRLEKEMYYHRDSHFDCHRRLVVLSADYKLLEKQNKSLIEKNKNKKEKK